MNLNDAVKTVLTAGGKSQADLAECWGISKQAITNKIGRETWTGKDLMDVAKLTGCRLLFEFPDGSKIVISDPEKDA